MIEWPINLAQSLQYDLVHDNITEPLPLLEVYRSKKELFTSDVFDVLFPQQPSLFACLILGCIFAAILLILFGVFVIARCIGACGADLYQKHPTNMTKFIGFASGLGINWLLLMLSVAYIVCCILHLGSGGRANLIGPEEIPVDIQRLNKTAEHPVKIDFNTITITEIKTSKREFFGEADLLNKYNSIRELGYEYRPIETDSDIHTQATLFSLISFIYAAILITTGTTMIIGLREYLYSYHPMDRTSSSNCCGRTFVTMALVLFGSAPFLLLISTFLLAYIQAHNGICPYVQQQAQNQNIESYANANFAFFDPYNLLDFLTDLAAERTEINRYNCEQFIRPLQGIWICLVFMTIAVIPAAILMLRLSKYYLRMSAKYYWNPMETYSTVPDTSFKTIVSPPRY